MTEELRESEMIYLLKKINISLEICLEKRLKGSGMSGTQVYFLVYILRHHPKGTYITEMCRETGLSKATLSVLVKKMREKGYLCFVEEPEDIRKKKVIPTEKLLNEGAEFMRKTQQMEDEICSALDSAERLELWELEHKILTRLGREQRHETDKTDNKCEEKDRQEVTA